MNADYCEHTAPLFKTLKLLNVFDIHKYQVGAFMYMCVNKLLPAKFCNFYTTINDIHSYNTRTSENLFRYLATSNTIQRTLKYSGPLLWNSLSNKLRQCSSLNTFKIHFKLHLINNYD